MTVQPTRDQPMTDHDRMNYWWRRATQAETRIKAVRELHVPDRPLNKYPDCSECTVHGYYEDGHCEDDTPVEWPCPTIRALDGDQ